MLRLKSLSLLLHPSFPLTVPSPLSRPSPLSSPSPAGEDKKRREAVDTKNQAESMIYQTEKQLKEFESKVPADVKVWTNIGRVWNMGNQAGSHSRCD